MLGETVRESRIRKGLTQARLARMAGVSRRHLAALEKGANVSILVLRKVAAVLELRNIQLGGGISVHPGAEAMVNVPLLADTLREARNGAVVTEELIVRAETLLSGGEPRRPSMVSEGSGGQRMTGHLPATMIWPLGPKGSVREGENWTESRTAGEVRQGHAINEEHREQVLVPPLSITKGRILFRARGDELRGLGIRDGDLIVAENRPRGRANNSELVMAKCGNTVWIGRLWMTDETKSLVDEHCNVIELPRRTFKVVAAITYVLRNS